MSSDTIYEAGLRDVHRRGVVHNGPSLSLETDNVPPKLRASHVTFRYGGSIALRDVSMPFFAGTVTALMGPSGCGKSTLLRVLNRLHDLYPNQHVEGEVFLDGQNILAPGIDVDLLRTRIGMVFQKPAPSPMSIYENVAFGIRTHWALSRKDLDIHLERALRRAALWDEVKDILSASALSLSGGQQQRL
jgi:phosphate transport system ATP-binding protein